MVEPATVSNSRLLGSREKNNDIARRDSVEFIIVYWQLAESSEAM